MTAHSTIKTKLLATFVVAFICLNAGGAVCVAYCQSFEFVAAQAEHCPLKKTAEHCDKSGQSEPEHASINLVTSEFDCCPMTVSFLAAPLEKNSLSLAQPAIAAAYQARAFKFALSADRTIPDTVEYRGPPPLDERVLRIRHCLIRI